MGEAMSPLCDMIDIGEVLGLLRADAGDDEVQRCRSGLGESDDENDDFEGESAGN